MADVLLALNESGANGSTGFLDQSPSAHVLTALGNAAWTNAQAPGTETTSQSSDGNGDGVSAVHSTDFDIGGTSAKTIELFVRANGIPGSQQGILWYGGVSLGWSTISGNEWVFYTTGGTNVTFQWNASGGAPSLAGTITLANAWVHIAITWDGTYLRLWLGGVLKATSANNPTITNTITPVSLVTGFDRPATTTTAWNGWLASLRIANSVKYTSDFTPPTPPFAGPVSIFNRRTLGPRVGSRS